MLRDSDSFQDVINSVQGEWMEHKEKNFVAS